MTLPVHNPAKTCIKNVIRLGFWQNAIQKLQNARAQLVLDSVAIAKVWPCAWWQQLSLNIANLSNWIHTYTPFLFKLRISYRLARFPHLSQAGRVIPGPVAAVFSDGVILRLAIDFLQAVKFQAKWPQVKLLSLLVEPEKLDNIFLERQTDRQTDRQTNRQTDRTLFYVALHIAKSYFAGSPQINRQITKQKER